jgi:hypothetical protein
LREKSEGSIGGVFSGAQKQKKPRKAGFGGASYMVGRGKLNSFGNLLIYNNIF